MNTAVTTVSEIRQSLKAMSPEFALVLPPQIDPDKFVRITISAVQQTPSLLSADRQSLYAACMKAAQDGLVLDGREAALVQFKDRVAYMPMIGGILKKIRQSGELKTIAAYAVYANDKFSYHVDDTGEHFKHEPEMDKDPGDLRLVYAVATTKDGGVYFDKMTVSEIERIRKSSRSGDRGPWVEWYAEMAKKSVLRRLAKRLPMSTDLPSEDEDVSPSFASHQPEFPPHDATPPVRNSKLQAVVDAVVDQPQEKDVI